MEFTDQLKDAWRRKVEQDLKGKPLSSLLLKVEEGVVLEPMYTKEEVDYYPPLFWRESSNDWKIVELFHLESAVDMTRLNLEILESLAGGCEVVEIKLDDHNIIDVSDLLNQVQLELISMRFFANGRTAKSILEYRNRYCLEKSIESDSITLEIYGQDKHEIVIDKQEKIHSQGLAHMLRDVQIFFTQNPTLGWQNLTISWFVGNQMIEEISKIRTIKLLIYALAEKLEKPLNHFPTLRANVDSHVITEELETLIERGTKAFTAIIGGVDEVCITPEFETSIEISGSDKKRMSRNIHWLLKMESQLTKSEDITNGAYWIEECTRLIFEKSWKAFNKGDEG